MRRPNPRVFEALLLGGVGALLSLAVFYPGFMSTDSINQLLQARSGDYTNIQPPLMSIIWHYVDMVLRGQTGMLILQNYLYWAGLALVLLPFRRQAWVYFFLLIGVGLFPPYFLLQGTIWKDHLMSGFLLLALGFTMVALLLRVEDDGRPVKRVICLIAAGVFVFLALMIRHNAVFAVLPPLYLIAGEFFAIRRPPKKIVEWRPLVAGAAATILMFFASTAASDGLARYHYNLGQLVEVFDLVGVAVRTGEPIFDAQKYPSLKEGFSDAWSDRTAVEKAYVPCDAFPIMVTSTWGTAIWKLGADPALSRQVHAAWWDAVTRHPREFVAHKFEVFLCSLSIGRMGPWYAPIFFMVQGDVGAAGGGFSPFQKFVADQAWYLTLTPVYAVWVYFVISTVIALLSLFGSRPLDRLAFCIAVGGLMYQGGYLLIAITTEFRYYIWMIISAVLSSIIFLLPRLLARGARWIRTDRGTETAY
jgi:hypothetical protein